MSYRGMPFEQVMETVSGTAHEAHLRMLDYKTYDDFVELVTLCVDKVFTELTRNGNFYYDKQEDEISNLIKLGLRFQGLDANHDEMVGGHCDIVVKGRYQYMWLAEAKISRGNKYLMGGFLQLATRYLAGDHKSTNSAVFIYCVNNDVPTIMSNWREKLDGSDFGFKYAPCNSNPNAFVSTHKHAATGLDMHVRHVPLPLYFDPQDRKK